MKRKTCPKCGAGVFYVTVHVTQEWEVDEHGSFINTVDDCVDVIHKSDDIDIWECVACGHADRGAAFNIKEE